MPRRTRERAAGSRDRPDLRLPGAGLVDRLPPAADIIHERVTHMEAEFQRLRQTLQ